MKLLPFLPTVLVLLTLVACQQGDPAQPAADPTTGPLAAPVQDFEIPMDEGLRELTTVLSGDLVVNGTSATPPGGVPSPGTITQPAATGELALIRVRATMSDGSTPTLHTNMRGAGGTAYSGMDVTADNRNFYKAMYVTGTESLALRLYNAPTWSGPINSGAAQFNYLYETRPIEDASEPNDDDNPLTIADRLLAKAANPGANLTRSMYEYSDTIKDREEWFRSTLAAGPSYDFKMTTYQPRYGTWSYVLNLYTDDGSLLRTHTIPAGAASGTLESGEILTSGTYYLQIIGTPVTRAFSSNLFYNPYTLNVCEDPVLLSPITFLPNQSAPGEMCPGTVGRWDAPVNLDGATYSWSFGGGCSPNTSTAPMPQVTLTNKGRYHASLTVRTPCGAVEVFNFVYDVACVWQSQWAKPGTATGSYVAPEEIAVQANGDIHMVATFAGTPVRGNVNHEGAFAPPVSSGNGGAGLNAMLVRLTPRGDVMEARNIASGNGPVRARGLAVDSSGNAYVTGFFYGTIDFDPSANTLNRTSLGNSDAFLAVYPASGATPIVGTWGATGFDSAESVVLYADQQPVVCGYYQSEVDFDPGSGVFFQSATGPYDGFVSRYSTSVPGTPEITRFKSIGGAGIDRAFDIAIYSNLIYVAGCYSGTVNFRNSVSPLNRTSQGGEDAFLFSLDANNFFDDTAQTVSTFGGPGTERAFAVITYGFGQVVFGGVFASTAHYYNASGVQSVGLVSQGNSDAFAMATSGGEHAWSGRAGGASADTLTDLVYVPATQRVFASGHFQGNATFIGTSPTWTVSKTATGSTDGYLMGFRVDGALHQHGGNGGVAVTFSTGGDSFTALGAPAGLGDLLVLGGTFTAPIAASDSGSKLWGFNLSPQGATDGFLLSLTGSGDFRL